MKQNNIHFMGIGGSGISGISVLAKKRGYNVSGCELEKYTDYLEKVISANIGVEYDHSYKHLKNIDLLVVSPAILFQIPDHPEVIEAKKRNILLTWEAFLGKYLMKDKEVICVAGTHGKSTTTAITSLIFEKAGKDPNVVLGAKIKELNGNFRYGKGNIFITEADEFYNNFLNYSPSAIILNNIEFDHPDFFKSYNDVVNSFVKFVKRLSGKKVLIINQDSPGIKNLMRKLDQSILKDLNVYGYTFKDKPETRLDNSVKITIDKKDEYRTVFSLSSTLFQFKDKFSLSVPGEFNVANASGAIILSKLYGIEDAVIKQVLAGFRGIGRRLELIGDKNGIAVYDDYAHHPTAIKATISALRQIYPKNRIWAIDEPHSFSRTKALLKDYKGVFDSADRVVIGPIFKARDNVDFGVDGDSIVKSAGHKNSVYLNEFTKITDLIKNESKTGDVILVMGAGKSYLWAKEIIKNI